MATKIVHRVEEGMDPRDVLATTYQMRNFYRELGDGFFSVLDVMNYIQHQQVVRWCTKGTRLLDVCCGRGLLLPLLRYQRKDLGSYTGIDIEPHNAKFLDQRVTDGKPIEPGYYPFPVRFVEANAATMDETVKGGPFDLIVYTSSIEHMQKEAGERSLSACRNLAHTGSVLVLTSPNTPEGRDGYETRYRAHVYEWKRSELLAALAAADWKVVTEYGLLIDKDVLHAEAERMGFFPMLERLEKVVPDPWLRPVFAPLFPKAASEIAFVAKAL